VQSQVSKLEAERAEIYGILSSGVFGRTNNHVRFLTFVCEKYFEGSIDEIKEYSIGVHALGRAESFDPQVDTIVRVTAHALRKRLEDYYRTAGAEHPVHICLPPGHYVPKFIHINGLEEAAGESKVGNPTHTQALDEPSSPENGAAQENQEIPARPLEESTLEKIGVQDNGSKSRIKLAPLLFPS
jgi:hypothetical protein